MICCPKKSVGKKKKIKLENKIRKRHLWLFKSQLKIGVQNSFFYGGEDRDTAKCLLQHCNKLVQSFAFLVHHYFEGTLHLKSFFALKTEENVADFW